LRRFDGILFLSSPQRQSDAEKKMDRQIARKSMFSKDVTLRTWRFARSQEVEKRERERGEKGEKPAVRSGAKSASRSEKPRQTWRLAGFIEMQRGCLCKFLWWSWRDLNPRPQTFFEQFYMCSRLI
jgi:hypothetical protein